MSRRTSTPLTLLLIWAAGCNGPSGGNGDLYARLQAIDPNVRIRAIRQAAERGDQDAVGLLVDRLTDSEEDVRLFAYLALKELTGRTMGYRPWESWTRREKAVDRWRQWLEACRPEDWPDEANGEGA